ncbi:MAG: nuclear transport factor 2 family protein [Alphaproteobacteria bacterium]
MKRALCVLILLVPLAACVSQLSKVMQACEKTVRDYALYRDEGPVDSYTALFTEDGTFQLGEAVTTGRDALKARHIAANKAAAWRHNMTDIRISPNADEITGRSRFIIMTGARTGDTGSLPTASRQIVGDYEDVFVIEDGACKIKSRTVNILFVNQ